MKDTNFNRNKTFIRPLVLILIYSVSTAILFWSCQLIYEKSIKSVKTSGFSTGQMPNIGNLYASFEKLKQKDKQLDKHALGIEAELNDLKEKMDNITKILMSARESYSQSMSPDIEFDSVGATEVVEEQAEAHLHTQLQTLEDTLHSETIDEDWSNSVSTVINEALSRPEMQDMELVEKHCGSTLCRLDLSFDNTTIDMNNIDEMLSLTSDRGEGFIMVNEEESNATLYFSKEDYSLFDTMQ